MVSNAHQDEQQQQLRESLLSDVQDDDTPVSAIPKSKSQTSIDEESRSPQQQAPPPSALPSFKDLIASPNQITAMLSNISAGYNIFSISLVIPILQSKSLYSDESTTENISKLASAVLFGMVFGQLMGGLLGDLMGKLRAMYLVIAVQIIASLGSSTVIFHGSYLGGYDILMLWRFLLGVGCGGVYPLSAVLSTEQQVCGATQDGEGDTGINAEYSDVEGETRQDILYSKIKRSAVTISTQGPGYLFCPIATLFMLYIMGLRGLDYVWRITLALGALPGAFLLFLRWKLYRRGYISSHEIGEVEARSSTEPGTLAAIEDNTEGSDIGFDAILETKSVDHHSQSEDHDLNDENCESGNAPEHDMNLWMAIKNEPNLFRKLCGTAGSWFLFDIVYYGNSLFQPIVLENAFGGGSSSNSDSDELELLLQTTRDSLLLTIISMPGIFVCIYFIGRRTCNFVQTLRYIQVQGFLLMAILYTIIGFYWEELKNIQWLLVTLYGSTFFFSYYGPGTTSFTLPSISYSPRCSSTLNGVSAACGKLGALIGASMFEPFANYYGDNEVMYLCAVTSILACLLTIFCVYV